MKNFIPLEKSIDTQIVTIKQSQIILTSIKPQQGCSIFFSADGGHHQLTYYTFYLLTNLDSFEHLLDISHICMSTCKGVYVHMLFLLYL